MPQLNTSGYSMTTEAEVYELLQLHFEVTISGTCVYRNHAGQLHRVHGPAIEWNCGTKEWWQNDQRHREDGPAVEYKGGHREWFLNGVLHRTDGPAVEHGLISREWWQNGKLHREDGPAVILDNNCKAWWLNGRSYTKQEYLAALTDLGIAK